MIHAAQYVCRLELDRPVSVTYQLMPDFDGCALPAAMTQQVDQILLTDTPPTVSMPRGRL